jgi:hypothetical protein
MQPGWNQLFRAQNQGADYGQILVELRSQNRTTKSLAPGRWVIHMLKKQPIRLIVFFLQTW